MSNRRVLHVDDDGEFLALAAEMLDRVAGIETVTELDPTAVPDRLAADDGIECVLCDYEMPGWTGLEVLEAVRDEYPDLPFLLYTGKGDESVAADVIALGASDYIPKGSGRDHFETVAERIERAVADARDDTDRRLDSLVHNAPFPIVAGWITRDAETFDVWDVNPAFEATFGHEAQTLRGESLDPYVVPETDRETATRINRAALDGDPVMVDVRRATVEGERPFLLTVVPAPEVVATDDGHDGVFAWGLYVDVSDRESHRERVTALHEVALDLGAAGTAASVHEATVTAAADVLSFDRCVLYHERDGVLEPVGTAGDTALGTVDPRPADSGIAGRTYCESTGTLLEDVRADPDATATDGVGSLVSVPVGDWGVLQVTADSTGVFDTFDHDLAYVLAAHAAAALDRIDRTQERRAYHRRLDRLHEATREFMSASSVPAVAEHAVDVAMDLLDLSVSVVYTHDLEDDRLRVLTRRQLPAAPNLADWDPGSGLVGRAFATGETLRAGGTDDRLALSEGVQSGIAFPLGDHGVLVFGDPEPNAFDDRDEHVGRVLAANVEAVLDRLVGERALRRREAQLERQNERLERFASLVSHDLRSPLEVVRGNVELAEIQQDFDRLDDALEALDRADELIEDMLTFARQGEHVTDVTPVALDRITEAAWPAAKMESDSDTSATLECETSCRIRADESRLQQLLENLFRNAIEHNDEAVTVRVLGTDDGFAVADDGTGLPSLSVTKLFDPGTSTADDGTGFGLSIVREIADAHGWTISVGESETGGARFRFVTDPTA
jgi:signal transduction histidine kinase/CheY-like chemotaxis protein